MSEKMNMSDLALGLQPQRGAKNSIIQAHKRLVFMGTPDFAVATLQALVEAGCHVVGVVTAPDKPAGRGMHLQQSAVKKYALEQGLEILQPEKLKAPAFIAQLEALKADIQVVVAFRMLPEVVWNMPALGTINLHGSLLPQYRGAAPINWAILNGETETGVTTFKLKHEIDTGDILLQESIAIGAEENAGSLHDRMKAIGAALMVKTIEGIFNGGLKERSQQDFIAAGLAGNAELTPPPPVLHHAPKIFTDTCKIDPSKTVTQSHNLVRGLSPFPGAFTTLNQKMLKVYEAKAELTPPQHAPGEFYTDGRQFLKMAFPDGYLNILELQLEGKKKMAVQDFLRGYKFE